jgi:hypothetical protein
VTDPDLVFDMDPRNVARVEQWIAARWSSIDKDSDGSRLTWTLSSPASELGRIVATESFLSLPAGEVERMLAEADDVCAARRPSLPCYLLLAVDGPRILES